MVSDSFTVDTVFQRRLCILLYIELATMRIVWFAVTANPDKARTTQQSRNLLATQGIANPLRDPRPRRQDVGPADAVLGAEGIRVIKTPIAAPKRTHTRNCGRRECLDWILILSRRRRTQLLAPKQIPDRGRRYSVPDFQQSPSPRQGYGVAAGVGKVQQKAND